MQSGFLLELRLVFQAGIQQPCATSASRDAR